MEVSERVSRTTPEFLLSRLGSGRVGGHALVPGRAVGAHRSAQRGSGQLSRSYKGCGRDKEAGSVAMVLKPVSRRAELTRGSTQVRELGSPSDCRRGLHCCTASAPGGPSPRGVPAGGPRVTGRFILAVDGSHRRDDPDIQIDANGFVCS